MLQDDRIKKARGGSSISIQGWYIPRGGGGKESFLQVKKKLQCNHGVSLGNWSQSRRNKKIVPDIYGIGTRNRWNETGVVDIHPITINGASMLRTEMGENLWSGACKKSLEILRELEKARVVKLDVRVMVRKH